MPRSPLPNPKASPLGNRIARLRRKAGLTQHQLAKAAGIGRATIAHIEIGHTQALSSETLARLAKGLRVTVATILPPHKTHRWPAPKSAA